MRIACASTYLVSLTTFDIIFVVHFGKAKKEIMVNKREGAVQKSSFK